MMKTSRKVAVPVVAGLIVLFSVSGAAMARYVESDPIGFKGGPNLYSYAGQNPAQWTDRRGLDQPPPGQWDSFYNLSGTNPPYSDDNNAMALGVGCMAACVNELYSPTGAAAQCTSAALATPLSKEALGFKLFGNASSYTNPISYAGYLLNQAEMSAPALSTPFLGTIDPYYAVGRANVAATDAAALYTGSALLTCQAACREQGGW